MSDSSILNATSVISDQINAQLITDDQTAAQNAQYQIMADYLATMNDAATNIQGDASQIQQK